MHLHLSLSNQLPLYEQIEEQIKDKVLSGELRSGDSLPSIRSLARDLTTSVITVKRAYQELEADGWIYTRPGLGTFVSAVDADRIRREALEMITENLSAALDGADKCGLPEKEVLRLLESMIKEKR